jgi:hypothetical protein
MGLFEGGYSALMHGADSCMRRAGPGKAMSSWIVLERRKSFPVLYSRLTDSLSEGGEMQTQRFAEAVNIVQIWQLDKKLNKDEAA